MRIGFSIKASDDDNKTYSEAITIFSICIIMNKYPTITENDIMEMTQSKIGTLVEMIWYFENPKWLDKYKKLKFSSEFEFEQYILNQYKL